MPTPMPPEATTAAARVSIIPARKATKTTTPFATKADSAPKAAVLLPHAA
jgi:hypothetical protein